MSIIIVEFKEENNDKDQHIEMLWSCMRMVRGCQDFPILWKLTTPFIESIGNFFHVKEIDALMNLKFLDTSLDMTSNKPVLVAERRIYPVDLINL